MRILAAADIHGTQAGFLTIKKLAKEHEPDMIVIAGDITHFGPGEWAREFLDSMELPTVAVNGNCDTQYVVDILAGHEHGLLDKFREIEGQIFLGLGYPFFSGFEPEQEPKVLVSHVPPMGCNDTVPGPRSIGDKELKKLVLRLRPKLVISGHVHESPGIVKLEDITCVNPGPARDGRAAIIDIGDDKITARLLNSQ